MEERCVGFGGGGAEGRDRRTEFAQLNARTEVCLSGVTLVGGYVAEADMPVGKPYDLRFMDDRLLVMAARGVTALLAFPYGHAEEVEGGGPGPVRTRQRGQQ